MALACFTPVQALLLSLRSRGRLLSFVLVVQRHREEAESVPERRKNPNRSSIDSSMLFYRDFLFKCSFIRLGRLGVREFVHKFRLKENIMGASIGQCSTDAIESIGT
jgi:hypothetical protein